MGPQTTTAKIRRLTLGRNPIIVTQHLPIYTQYTTNRLTRLLLPIVRNLSVAAISLRQTGRHLYTTLTRPLLSAYNGATGIQMLAIARDRCKMFRDVRTRKLTRSFTFGAPHTIKHFAVTGNTSRRRNVVNLLRVVFARHAR